MPRLAWSGVSVHTNARPVRVTWDSTWLSRSTSHPLVVISANLEAAQISPVFGYPLMYASTATILLPVTLLHLLSRRPVSSALNRQVSREQGFGVNLSAYRLDELTCRVLQADFCLLDQHPTHHVPCVVGFEFIDRGMSIVQGGRPT